jgi:pimeloyl-ACP methyl ester carboxylesterase
MASWVHGYWLSDDGLRLHYRDYQGSDRHPPIICIPGLTRNARDFEGVAERLAGDWRLICVELRGRGESGYSRNPMSYVPHVYLNDLETLLAGLGLNRIVLFGTSLGGMLTMLLALRDHRRIAGAVINDVGPVLDARGVARIRGVVGRAQSWPTWLHAARHYAEIHGEIHPKWKLDRWLVHAKRLCRLNSNGRIVLDYDMRIAEPFKTAPENAQVAMWEAFEALKEVPTLLIRGAFSDILSAETFEQMAARNPEVKAVTIPDVGHAPTLEEPEAVEAIDRLLERIAASG